MISWLEVAISHLELEFYEEGNLSGTLVGEKLTVTYTPFDDSPYPSTIETYHITRLKD